jgi:hypothetical protein
VQSRANKPRHTWAGEVLVSTHLASLLVGAALQLLSGLTARAGMSVVFASRLDAATNQTPTLLLVGLLNIWLHRTQLHVLCRFVYLLLLRLCCTMHKQFPLRCAFCTPPHLPGAAGHCLCC